MPLLYIVFEILNRAKFEDFLRMFHLIEELRFKEQTLSVEFWNEIIPAYSQSFFNNVSYGSANYKEDVYDFVVIMDYLQHDMEVDFIHCQELESNTAKIEFVPYAFPYGGMERLIMFLKTFECISTEADIGNDVRKITWGNNGAFDFEFSKKK